MKYSEERIQRVSAYAHKLNAGMVQSMIDVYREYLRTGKPVNVIKLKTLTYNQSSNFQKLKFWGLVTSPEKGSGYFVTPKGLDFLRGRIPVLDLVASLENEVLPYTHQCWQTHKTKPQARMVHEFLDMDKYTYYKNYEEFREERGSDIPSLF